MRTDWISGGPPIRDTHILLLFIHMSKLKPNVPSSKGSRRVVEDISEALHMLVKDKPFESYSPPNWPDTFFGVCR
jgi:hypothetical protein